MNSKLSLRNLNTVIFKCIFYVELKTRIEKLTQQ